VYNTIWRWNSTPISDTLGALTISAFGGRHLDSGFGRHRPKFGGNHGGSGGCCFRYALGNRCEKFAWLYTTLFHH